MSCLIFLKGRATHLLILFIQCTWTYIFAGKYHCILLLQDKWYKRYRVRSCCYSIWASHTRWFYFCSQRECYTNTNCNLMNNPCILHTEYCSRFESAANAFLWMHLTVIYKPLSSCTFYGQFHTSCLHVFNYIFCLKRNDWAFNRRYVRPNCLGMLWKHMTNNTRFESKYDDIN